MEIGSFKGVEFPNGMPQVKLSNRFGDQIALQRNNLRQMGRTENPVSKDNVAGSFAEALNNALSGAERLDIESKKLTEKAIYDPDSVDIHTVMIASEKARFALNFTKTVADGMVRAFKELSNPR